MPARNYENSLKGHVGAALAAVEYWVAEEDVTFDLPLHTSDLAEEEQQALLVKLKVLLEGTLTTAGATVQATKRALASGEEVHVPICATPGCGKDAAHRQYFAKGVSLRRDREPLLPMQGLPACSTWCGQS